MMAALGIVVAVVVDVVLPLAIILVLLHAPRSRRQRRSGIVQFWTWCGIWAGVIGIASRCAFDELLRFHGEMVLAATLLALPGGIVPAVFNSNVIHYFFTDDEWLAFGYIVVLPVYLAGLIPWALVLPVAIRHSALRGAQ